jgi:hypothetical protein
MPLKGAQALPELISPEELKRLRNELRKEMAARELENLGWPGSPDASVDETPHLARLGNYGKLGRKGDSVV